MLKCRSLFKLNSVNCFNSRRHNFQSPARSISTSASVSSSIISRGHLCQSSSLSMCLTRSYTSEDDPQKNATSASAGATKKTDSAKILREKTPIGKLDELGDGPHPYQEKEPLPPWPDNTNPHTGEVGGPRGPEPTRYGDWERKGRVTDF